MENGEPIVKLRKVSKTYQSGTISVAALSDIDLDIEALGFVSLHGPSGSGKTTLLNIIGGLDNPSAGEVHVAGTRMDLLSNAARAQFRLRELGFIFQAYNLIPVLSALENVEFVMQLQGISAEERSARAREVLGEVGLTGMESRRPSELSGGQQQRVAVARAIASKPRIVLADEPTANLDSNTATNLLELMRHMNESHGVTFIFSTHDKLVMQYAKRLVGLRDGRIESDERRN